MSDLHIELTTLARDLGQAQTTLTHVLLDVAPYIHTADLRRFNEAVEQLLTIRVALDRITNPQEVPA